MGRKKTSPFGLPWDAPGTHNIQSSWMIKKHHSLFFNSRVSNIESDKSQNVGLEDYNNISDRIFPYIFNYPLYKDNPRVEENWKILSNFNALLKQSAMS